MLQLNHIAWTASDGKQVLKDVNLNVGDGKLVVITGPNGSGKTTLARLIAGIDKPEAGQIVLNGEDITNLDVTERARRGVSFAFQQPVRFKGITVRQLIETAAKDTLNEAQLCEILGRVGLCARDYIDREVNATLSGGEIKRIEIATVLARHTSLSIFDEPEAGIDLWSFTKLTETFRMLHGTRENTIIVISHQERIIDLADEIVMISGGKVVRHGPKEEIMPHILADTAGMCQFLQPNSKNCRQPKEG